MFSNKKLCLSVHLIDDAIIAMYILRYPCSVMPPNLSNPSSQTEPIPQSHKRPRYAPSKTLLSRILAMLRPQQVPSPFSSSSPSPPHSITTTKPSPNVPLPPSPILSHTSQTPSYVPTPHTAHPSTHKYTSIPAS